MTSNVGYELWDNETLNLIDDFADEGTALAAVRQVIEENGTDAVASWALDRADHAVPPLQGKTLIERALATATA